MENTGTDNTASSDRPAFQPRIGSVSGPAPYNPRFYFLVAFFGGPIAIAIVAYQNLGRLGPNRDSLRQRTLQIIGVLIVLATGFLLISPAGWWDPSRNIRLALQVLAAIASLPLTKLHEPAALAMSTRHGGHTSMWRAIGWIIAGAVAQGIISAIVAAARGVI